MKYDHSSIFMLANSSLALWRNEVDGTKEENMNILLKWFYGLKKNKKPEV